MGQLGIVDAVPPASGMAWKPELWEQVAGEISYVGTVVGRDFEDKVNQLQARIDLVNPQGARVTLWPVLDSDVDATNNATAESGYPDRMARALSQAVEAAGRRDIETGGYIVGQRVADVPPTKAGYSPAKDFVFQYTPPAAQSVQMPQAPPEQPAAAPPAAPAPQMAPPPAQPPQQAPVPAQMQPAPQQPVPQPPPAQAPPQQMAPQVAPQAMAAAQAGPDINALSAGTGIPQTVLSAMTPDQLAALAAGMGG